MPRCATRRPPLSPATSAASIRRASCTSKVGSSSSSSRRSAATCRPSGPKPSSSPAGRSRRRRCSARRDPRFALYWCRVRRRSAMTPSKRTWTRPIAGFRITRASRHGRAPTRPFSRPTALPPPTDACVATRSSRAMRAASTRFMKIDVENSVPFFDALQLATAGARAELFAVPVIRQCLAGQVTRAQYLAFLTEAYHHVKHTVPLLMACGARLPDDKAWLRDAVAHYIEEERGHDQWILDDIAAAGGDKDAVQKGGPRPATELMVAYVYDFIARRNPVGFFGMVHVLEGASAALATNAAAALEWGLGLPASALRYLRSHGEVDRAHVLFFADLMNRIE